MNYVQDLVVYAAAKQQIDVDSLYKEQEIKELKEGRRVSKIKTEGDVQGVKNRVIIIVSLRKLLKIEIYHQNREMCELMLINEYFSWKNTRSNKECSTLF